MCEVELPPPGSPTLATLPRKRERVSSIRFPSPVCGGGARGGGIIRPYRPSDREAVEAICAETGLRGQLENYFCDRALFVKLWLSAYLDGQPEFARVVEDENGAVAGYLVGSIGPGYKQRVLRYTWRQLLTLAGRYLIGRYRNHPPSERFVRWLLLRSWRETPKVAPDLAAHFHFNLREDIRGRWIGVTLLRTFEEMVRDTGLAGWHAIVFCNNPATDLKKYRYFGLTPVSTKPCSLFTEPTYVAYLEKRFTP